MIEIRHPAETRPKAANAAWKDLVAVYQEPNAWRASWQMVNTFGSYVALWALMRSAAGRVRPEQPALGWRAHPPRH